MPIQPPSPPPIRPTSPPRKPKKIQKKKVPKAPGESVREVYRGVAGRSVYAPKEAEKGLRFLSEISRDAARDLLDAARAKGKITIQGEREEYILSYDYGENRFHIKRKEA